MHGTLDYSKQNMSVSKCIIYIQNLLSPVITCKNGFKKVKPCSLGGFGNLRTANWRTGNMRTNSANYGREPRVQCEP